MEILLLIMCILVIIAYGVFIYLIINKNIEMHFDITENGYSTLTNSQKYAICVISGIIIMFALMIIITIFE